MNPSLPELTNLEELQRRMAAAVMRPLTNSERMQPKWDGDLKTSDVAESFIKPNDRLSSFDRLEIYNRQYWFRLLDCLYEDYPGLCAVLGGNRFHQLAIAYLTKYPSTSPMLSRLGEHLVRFIKENPELCQPYELLCAEVAEVEWAQTVAFDAESVSSSTLENLAEKAPDQVFLKLQPYITILALSYPADEVVLRVLDQDAGLGNSASNAVAEGSRSKRRSIARSIKPEPTWLVVHRHENAVYFKRILEPQFELLNALDQGVDLASACEKLLSRHPGVAAQEVGQWFQTWAGFGFLVARD